jgi:hypothetical protein
MRNKHLLLVFSFFITCIISCDSGGVPDKDRYGYDVIPPANCQDDALFCAVWAERYGYESLVYIGDLRGVAHAQARMTDFNKEKWWLRRNHSRYPTMEKEISDWEPKGYVTTDIFFSLIKKWSLENNFYREQ